MTVVPGAGPAGVADAVDARTAGLEANLAVVRARVATAALAAGRDPAAVQIIAVSKNMPAADVLRVAGLGITDVGENRDQEAAAKHRECSGAGLRWHFVGQLQRNKAASVARYADVVHSVDRRELVQALDRGAARAGRRIGVCLQVDLAGGSHQGRGGAEVGQVLGLAELVERAEHLELLGVMAVAPLGGNAELAFAELMKISGLVVADHPQATMISAGMSSDMESAIAVGATHVRIGSALFGARQRSEGNLIQDPAMPDAAG